jgi:NAD(P)-dependent dehydrogenase (short-subunit alcohol dehydrogenase family)
MTDRLRGKTAFITGAASGIGRASALLFAAEGARIAACDINAAGGEDVAQAIRQGGGDAQFLQADVTDEQAVARAFAAAADRYGPPDVLHNCAGGSTDDDAATGELSVDTLDRVLRVDLRSVILCSQAAIKLMSGHGGGSIINMSSFVAFRGVFNIHAYISAKGALVSLTRAMAGRYGSTRSRPASRSVSVPRPGWRRATSRPP